VSAWIATTGRRAVARLSRQICRIRPNSAYLASAFSVECRAIEQNAAIQAVLSSLHRPEQPKQFSENCFPPDSPTLNCQRPAIALAIRIEPRGFRAFPDLFATTTYGGQDLKALVNGQMAGFHRIVVRTETMKAYGIGLS
jgi:hypothetical protein